MGFELSSPLVLDIKILISFGPILEWRQNKGFGIVHNTTVSKSWSHKRISSLEKTIVVKFDLFVTVGV